MNKIISCLLFWLISSPLHAQYCIPTSIPCSGDYIANVTFGGINRTSICDSPSTGYGYYPSFVASISPGQSLPISLSPGTPFAQAFIAWIDFNMDYTFSSNEIIFSNPNISFTTVTGTVTIPTNATTGVTRMRVRCADQIITLSNNPCVNLNFGETEDYLVSIDGLATSVSSSSPKNIFLFPNPANDRLIVSPIEQREITNEPVEIFNVYGQLCYSEILKSDHSIAMDQLADGLYFLLFQGTYHRFMVQHH